MPVFFNVAIILAIAGYAYFQGLSWALKTRAETKSDRSILCLTITVFIQPSRR